MSFPRPSGPAMAVEELLRDLEQRGVKLVIKDNKLRVSGLNATGSPALVDLIRRNKTGLVDCLRGSS